MNKKILLTLILALVLSISCFASVVNAADDNTLTATVTATAGEDGIITVTVKPNKIIKTGIFQLTYNDIVECTTPDVKTGAVQIIDKEGYVNIGFYQNSTEESVTLTFKPVSEESIGKDATFAVRPREGYSFTLADGTEVASENVVLNDTKTVTVTAPTPDISKPDVSTPDISNPDTSKPDVSTPDVSNPDTSKPDVSTPAKSGDETAAEGPMPQTGVNVLTISTIVLATIVAGYIARKRLVK